MYRVLIQTGSIECDEYTHTDYGIELYDEDQFVAFVPYENLLAVVDETTKSAEDRAIL
ncbi:hypothetical protein C499_13640 [Halogeometricum borinquense DSM 11551]|uniref:Uncharacterized protein n=1 Tax=Halogeometricum borinquense (strain ATCC 700274 / DSM 11551 / JCM 10706 / KCTC 4070 / PR3) TaxID=469382 RepID=E4NU78_HALBP|nr:hypothetical protein [Halogeometricum borinquense]ADQ68598.1 hypothetical protein Hbor_30610 [Halogeometricum borinquense DSM 11551]ELY25531.1 hypothetical protein C499_13640 [Halogeometricum borinquense DSM 11551]